MMSKRDAYVEKLKAQLDEMNAELDSLSARIRTSGADLRIRYEKQVEDFHRQRDAIQQRLRDIQGAGEDGWEKLRQGAVNAWGTLRESIDQAKAEFERSYKGDGPKRP